MFLRSWGHIVTFETLFSIDAYVGKMVEEQQNDNMVGKPLFDILSKLPSKSVLRFRCVSKLWREFIDDSYFVSVHDKQVIQHPTPIIFYSKEYQARTLYFQTFEYETIANDVFELVVKKSTHEICYSEFVGSCNGLLLIKNPGSSSYMSSTYIVIHPINKQCYVLPSLPYISTRDLSCGLGFDSSTNTFKMVCVYPRTIMVHVFGTEYSWRDIPQVPPYPISGKAIFAHGCLHWLAGYNSDQYGTRQVIWFDIKNEEFGLIRPPKTISQPSKRKCNYHSYDHLLNLDGQVGYFCNKTTEVWVLNHKKEWMLHCDFEDSEFLHDGSIKVLGCLNKDGDILIKVTPSLHTKKERFYIYNLGNRVIHEAHIQGLDLEYRCETEIVMFPNSLCDIVTNSNLFKKRFSGKHGAFWAEISRSFKSKV